MSEIKNKITSYSKIFYRLLLFSSVALLIAYLVPRERKFSYVFSKGQPWHYGVLIAPFDFGIIKSEAQLQSEKDSIEENFRAYFLYNKKIANSVKEELRDKYEAILPSLTQRYSVFQSKKYSDLLLSTMLESIDIVYLRGVISLPQEYSEKSKDLELMLIKNNIVEPYHVNEFFTLRSAYSQLLYYMNNSGLFDNKPYNCSDIFSILSINEILKANINIDNKKTQIVLNNLLKELPTTQGLVISGQKIVDQGEIINEDTYNKIISYKKEYENRVGTLSEYNMILVGHIIIVFLLVFSLLIFVYLYRRNVYDNIKHITFLLVMVAGMILATYVANILPNIPLWVVPFAILPLMVRTFIDSRLAFFFYTITILIASYFSNDSFFCVIIQMGAGIAATFSLYKMVRRGQLVTSAIIVFVTYSVFYVTLKLIQNGSLNAVNYRYFVYFAVNGLLILMVYPLIYIFEKIFGFLSDVTLVELSNTNSPLLRKLAETAPGTFQHSIQVANLAQEAAYVINANPLLVYAGAMYHDIGKTANPEYFTENQSGKYNPHLDLSYEESAKAIISHVTEGEKLANKHNLPQTIINFISTHHGTSKTWYFYNSFKNKYPEKEVDEAAFTYPGPAPFSKETAILMMADSVEAASRSLPDYNNESINNLVENIINTQMKNGQFNNAPITFKEISQIKEVFKRKLKNIYHIRISYPKLNKDKKKA